MPADTAAARFLKIGQISVEGNTATDSARIIRSFEAIPGTRYSADAVRHGMRKLIGLGLFDDVWVERFEHDDVVDLVIHVRERPRLSKVEVVGAKQRETTEVERKLFLRAGAVYSPTMVQTQIDSLLYYYREEGFAQAKVEAVTDTTGGSGQVALRFVIQEGEKVKIEQIRFVGATAFPEKELLKQLKSKRRGFLGGGDVKEENFAEDQQKLEAYYRNHGYRDMRVLGRELLPGKDAKRLQLVYTIEEGPLYRLGEVTWTGNRVLEDAVMRGLLKYERGIRYDASLIEKAQGGAYSEYAERGYLYVGIEPRETVRDSIVDVVFQIAEGQPSTVRMVNIIGNRGTREKVIRREIDIHEGEVFRRSALVRTQGDIFRLGLFEDVQIDFTPADSTDVDINLRVKEKQVGTASAGAGYTSESGLTGFLELGHNNVLGNAQSLQLHLERGGKRSNYFLSFTEPWFRDTPTLLGFSVFNNERQLDLYTEKRVGGSARVGRPLPWVDYTHGSLAYRIEDVTIFIPKPDSELTVQDSLVLAGLENGEAVRTSSVEAAISRNSTDNPFYPRKGTRLTLTSEIAGGPFGGNVHFYKERVEGRIYFPSIVKRAATMLKGRFGVLGDLNDRGTVPNYERFRLGGGSTVDPLRGYEDYQVVPEKFIIDVPITRTIIDTTQSPADTSTLVVGYNRSRYPGGRYMISYSMEQQFPIVHPLRGVIFFDAGNTWDVWSDIRPWDLKCGAGAGFRMEIPLLGNIGFDYAYGFHRDDGPRWKGHFLIGNVNF